MKAQQRRALVPLWCVLLVMSSLGIVGAQRTQAARPAYLAKDIQRPDAPLRPDALMDVNGTLVFAADNVGQGRELWESNGTAADPWWSRIFAQPV
jgi:hypothetical protein